MFDGFLKSRFYNKCKSKIKLTKTRLEVIKRKRNARQKYFNSDIAELIKAGLDKNAYDRAEGLLVEQNMSSCYDFIQQFCGCISTHLSAINKQKGCPEECREAVPSLMFAAARFADLPELRDLRKLFTDRYGNSLERFINKEFVERLRQKPPTKDMKLQVMHDIAQQYAIDWDSKALEHKLFTPPPPDQGVSKHASFSNAAADDGFNLQRSWPDKSKDQLKSHKSKDDFTDKLSDGPQGRKDIDDFGFKPHRNEKNEGIAVMKRDSTKQDTRHNSSSSLDSDRPFDYKFIPPPYTKPNIGTTKTKSDEYIKSNDNADDTEKNHKIAEAKPKAKSVRRRGLKPPPGRENDEIWKSKQEAKQGLGIILVNDGDQRDQEEKMMDGLLMHYSNKKSPYESKADDTWISRRNKQTPERAISVPLQPPSPSMSKGRKDLARTDSLQPEMLAVHVHPKLPDYDELAARLAVLSGK